MTATGESQGVERPQPRLAELVMHLAQCSPTEAVDAVSAAASELPADVSGLSSRDPLAVVAAALVHLKHVDLRDRIDLREGTAKVAKAGKSAPRASDRSI